LRQRHRKGVQERERLDDIVLQGGAIMDLGGWLRSLGLERYEAVFRENEIDDTVLPNLTAEDLKELGVSALGLRRKLLDAIAPLRSEPSPNRRPPNLHQHSQSPLKKPPGAARSL
jgi:hypothetical protein